MAKPTIKELATVILELSEKTSEQKLAKVTASYLQQERRTGELDAIMREVKELRKKKTGLTEADVTSAFPIDATVKKQIKQLFGQNVLINETIDKSVIGGVRVETNEKYLDLTVRNRLNQLKSIRQGATN